MQNSDHITEIIQNTELYILYYIKISHMVIRNLTRFKNLPDRSVNVQKAFMHVQQLSCCV